MANSNSIDARKTKLNMEYFECKLMGFWGFKIPFRVCQIVCQRGKMSKMQPDLFFLKAPVNDANQNFHPKCINTGGGAHRLERGFLKQWHVCDLSWSSFTRASNNVVTGWQHLPWTDLQNARLGAWLIYMQTAMRCVDRHIYHGQTRGLGGCT